MSEMIIPHVGTSFGSVYSAQFGWAPFDVGMYCHKHTHKYADPRGNKANPRFPAPAHYFQLLPSSSAVKPVSQAWPNLYTNLG